MEGMIQGFEAGLTQLQRELDAYSDEQRLWKTEGRVNNSAGNLVLHLVGNLNHFIGSELGKSGYVRDRPAEFGDRDVPRAVLTEQITATTQMLREVLGPLAATDMARTVQTPVFDEPQTLERWIVHLLGHLHYHLGQVSYHRRLLDS